MTIYIENISKSACEKGQHVLLAADSILIQIIDPDMKFPVPREGFKETYRFRFFDTEDHRQAGSFDDTQAEQLADILLLAKHNKHNVVVHCVAGICRSGAVVEVGSMIGFTPVSKYRQPNLLVKSKLMDALGFISYTNE